jgi:large subunit ribosomal protein L22
MAITAKLQNLKITARKVRLVADLIRRKPVMEAEAILKFTSKKACLPMLKLLQSAMATAKNTYKLDPKDFYISKLMVNDGRMQERVFPRSRGRADKIQKRTSHIAMELGEIKTIDKAAKIVKKEKLAKIAK